MDYLCFGEILFDVFPYGAKLGGAPLNVASHMTKLGLQGCALSALGPDELGDRARKEITELGQSLDYIKTVDVPTGRADIVLTDGNADYSFNDPCAWDRISVEEKDIPEEVDILYFGTLAQRSEVSRETVRKVLAKCKAKEVFYDVNLRKLWFTPELLREGMEKATILKMNDEELPIILTAADCVLPDWKKAVEKLAEKYNLKVILITLGKDGSTLYTNGKWFKEGTGKVTVVDTVGAGDSLSAGFLVTYLKTGDVEKALKVGAHLASYVVTQPGAIPEYSEEVTTYLQKEGLGFPV